MKRLKSKTHMALAAAVALCATSSLSAQSVWGTVLDSSNGRPVSMAAVYLMNLDHEPAAVAMADSIGRYHLSVPFSGEYHLVAQRFGYKDLESPLLSISDEQDYPLDLELRPEPLGLGQITVTVRNEQVLDWLRLELGGNPEAAFGFRLLQGERLAEARAKANNDPTGTLRWLYIPVQHGGACVSINSVPRAVTVGWRGPRASAVPTPGAAPIGTRSMEDAGSTSVSESARCGSLFVNDRLLTNEHIDEIDMSAISVVVTLPGVVRMYTYDFDWSFRRR